MTNWKLTPILPDRLTATINLTEVYTAAILDPKQISRLIRELNKYAPLPSLLHLKRCHDSRVIVSLMDTATPQSLADLVPGMDLAGLDPHPRRQSVVSEKPRTRAQYEAAMLYWPTNYHEDKYLERVLNDCLFDAAQLADIERNMRLAMEATSGVGVAVVDPVTGVVLVTCEDARRRHPLKHAVMVAVDEIARLQGGGAWGLGVAHRKRDVSGVVKVKTGPYLCTGYVIYVTREPCAMCAMALVHSRVKRVFYGCANDEAGALGSRAKLHLLSNLNHNYEVFAGVLATECGQMWHEFHAKTSPS